MAKEGNQRKVAETLLEKLSKWGAYIYHEATTGSMYIKFPHWGLGSIRVGDHKGITKYRYRWRVRLDKPAGYHCNLMDRGTTVLEVSPVNLDLLIEQFEAAAAARSIQPGDTETWDEYLARTGRAPVRH
jgi:hypothetical protein